MDLGKERSFAFEYLEKTVPPQSTRFNDKLADLNELLGVGWKFFDINSNCKIAARLDPLPCVEGDRHQWQYVLSALLSMIVLHPPVGSRLFLHIKCQQFVPGKLAARLKKDFHYYRILFFTNIDADACWKELYAEKLTEISTLVNLNKGAFMFNLEQTGDCLFSITLSGKLK